MIRIYKDKKPITNLIKRSTIYSKAEYKISARHKNPEPSSRSIPGVAPANTSHPKYTTLPKMSNTICEHYFWSNKKCIYISCCWCPLLCSWYSFDIRQNRGGLKFCLRLYHGGCFSCSGGLLYEGGGITVRNKDRWQMFLFLRDDWWFGHEALRPVVQTLNNTAFYWLGVVRIIRQVVIGVSRFSVDAGGKAAVRFSRNWRAKKGDLTLFLGFHGKADGGLLTVEMRDENCRSQRFDCLLLVFIRRWGRLVTRHHITSHPSSALRRFKTTRSWCPST